MDERRCGVPEEWLIDWLRGNPPAGTCDAMSRHLEGCADCVAALQEWRELLGEESLSEALPPEAEKSKRLLRTQVRRVGWRRRAAKLGTGSGWIAAAACAIAFMLAVPSLLERQSGQAEQRKPAQAYAAAYEPNGAALMARSDTVVYALEGAGVASSGDLGAGRPSATAWVNGRTGEMFLLLEGLLPSDRLDVQAWGNLDDRLTNLGLLEFHSDQGHLYSRNGRLPAYEEVAFTIEPKGGSTAPTSPRSATVRLSQ
ncbi:anti-sigma factor domain-containing protein [Cohnella sp. GCM10027633]|uniref:anti-sigma factor domain-containing protein n=1 Tax=unclassified Cohnella TaxID=2636738 RepID=UPI00362DDD9D